MTDYPLEDYLRTESAFAPNYTHDGTRLLYRSTRPGTAQVFMMPAGGGPAEQLTDYEDGVDFVVPSPVADRIIFGKASKGDEQTQLYLMDLVTREVVALTDDTRVKHSRGDWSPDGRSFSFASTARNGTDFDVHVMDVDTRSSRLLYAPGGYWNATRFSPDGTKLVAMVWHAPTDADLWLVDVASGEATLLTPHEGAATYGWPAWLPDGSGFYARSNQDRDFTGVMRYDLASATWTTVLAPEWDIDEIELSRDGSRLATVTNEDGYGVLFSYDTATMTGTPVPAPRGVASAAVIAPDGKSVAFNLESPIRPLDVWTWREGDAQAFRRTESAHPVPSEAMVEAELVRFPSFDGLELSAFVYRPREATGRLPAIVSIHGGPEGQSRPTFNPVCQYYVSRGYVRVEPNVRGSTGYGKRFMTLDDRERRMDSVNDLRGLHAYLASRPDIDAGRVALSGGSYGGYMVLAGLAFQSELWKAGVDIVGIANLVTFLENTSAYRRAMREVEYGYLATQREFLASVSPYNHVEAIRAPLFIAHGRNDPRVPVSETEQMAARMREQGLPVELVIYEDEGHGLAKLKNRLDAHPRIAAFLDRHLAPDA